MMKDIPCRRHSWRRPDGTRYSLLAPWANARILTSPGQWGELGLREAYRGWNTNDLSWFDDISVLNNNALSQILPTLQTSIFLLGFVREVLLSIQSAFPIYSSPNHIPVLWLQVDCPLVISLSLLLMTHVIVQTATPKIYLSAIGFQSYCLKVVFQCLLSSSTRLV